MKTFVSIGLAILAASLAVPEALGQHAEAGLDRMPIFGMPAAGVDRNATTFYTELPMAATWESRQGTSPAAVPERWRRAVWR